jgi:hypothetical protein
MMVEKSRITCAKRIGHEVNNNMYLSEIVSVLENLLESDSHQNPCLFPASSKPVSPDLATKPERASPQAFYISVELTAISEGTIRFQ